MSKRESYSLFKSLIALLLIAGCIWAAQWQYHRGVVRHERNNQIEARADLPAITIATAKEDALSNEWRAIEATGEFDSTRQILLRNRYSEGKYGYEVLTLFTSDDSRKFWVDRGWVEAGATATTAPVVTPVPEARVSITGRLRLDSSLPRGSFFALPGKGQGLVSELNAQSQLDTEKFY